MILGLFHGASETRFAGPRGISPKLLFHGAGGDFNTQQHSSPREIHGMDYFTGQGFFETLEQRVHPIPVHLLPREVHEMDLTSRGRRISR